VWDENWIRRRRRRNECAELNAKEQREEEDKQDLLICALALYQDIHGA
jgi:predicted RNase H-like nuclease